MSNAEKMVSVPRDEIEAACARFAKAQIFDFSRRMRSLLEQPAEHHQGEPVHQWSDDDGVSWCDGNERSLQSAREAGWETRTLYTRADPGEVERPLDEYEKLWSDFVMIDNENETLRIGMKGDYDLDAWLAFAKESKSLRAKLAEREALLRKAQSFVEARDDDSQEWMDLSSAISNALSASTEPIVPTSAKDKEQAAFEEWLDRVRPIGDSDSVHTQWLESHDYEEFVAELEPSAPVERDERASTAFDNPDALRLLSADHCKECGHPDCNGQCYGDDMMGDS